MSIVGRVRTPGGSTFPAPITSTLFGRCDSPEDAQNKIVKISDDTFEKADLSDGFTLKVYFKHRNTCDFPNLVIVKLSYNGESQNPIVPPTENEKLVPEIPIMSFSFVGENDINKYHTLSNFMTTTWDKGGIISFTFMRPSASTVVSIPTLGDYWIIDNQALESCEVHGSKYGGTFLVDYLFGRYTNSTLTKCGYENPNIANGKYLYEMQTDANGFPYRETSPSTTTKSGILEVISCKTIGGSSKHDNYILEEWTYLDEPQHIYRRIWAEPSSSFDWTSPSNNGWSPWRRI